MSLPTKSDGNTVTANEWNELAGAHNNVYHIPTTVVDIGAAVNLAFAALTTGGIVQLPPGEYTTATPIVFPADGYMRTLRGAGRGGGQSLGAATDIHFTGATVQAVTIQGAASECYGVIEDVRFDGPGSGNLSSVGIIISEARRETNLSNVFVNGFGVGVHFDATFGHVIDKLRVYQCGTGVEIRSTAVLTSTPKTAGCNTITFLGLIAESCTTVNVLLQGDVSTCIFLGGIIEGVQGPEPSYEIILRGDATGVRDGLTNIHFISIDCETAKAAGVGDSLILCDVDVAGSSAYKPKRVTFRACSFGDSFASLLSAAKVTYGQDILFEECLFVGIKRAASHCVDAAYANAVNVRIQRPIFFDDSNEPTLATGGSIEYDYLSGGRLYHKGTYSVRRFYQDLEFGVPGQDSVDAPVPSFGRTAGNTMGLRNASLKITAGAGLAPLRFQRTDADTNDRYQVDENGVTTIGPGNAAQDVGFGRGAANRLDVSPGDAFVVQGGTAAQRDAITQVNGMFWYNTDTNKMQVRENGAWQNLV